MTETVTWLVKARKRGIVSITFTLKDDATGATVQNFERQVRIHL